MITKNYVTAFYTFLKSCTVLGVRRVFFEKKLEQAGKFI